MEWIIGIIVVFVIWKLLGNGPVSDAYIQKEIVNIYLNKRNQWYSSNLSYENYRNYAIARDNEEDIERDGGKSITVEHKLLDGTVIKVLVLRNRRNGKADIIVKTIDDIRKEGKALMEAYSKSKAL